jgi:hypothetical protein
LIGEANSEREAREEFLSRWDTSGSTPEELILSIRELPNDTFLSRWWPSEYAPDDGLLPGQLDGGICDDSDVYEKEYPLITAAHKKLPAFRKTRRLILPSLIGTPGFEVT